MLLERDRKPVVLTLIGAFWPGSDSSGPNLSFKAMAEALHDEYDFRQISRDRPFGASQPVVESGSWIDHGYAHARYCAPGRLGAAGLVGILSETPHDLLLLNGFFDRDFTIPALVLRKLGRVPERPTIVSPRGEFSQGALGLKSGRKTVYKELTRRGGLLSDVWLHATSEAELQDIKRGFPWAKGYLVAPNVRTLIDPAPGHGKPHDTCRLAFVGRISPIKNVHLALAALAGVEARVDFEIYGPAQDVAYWRECERMIASLPGNITVRYQGEIGNDAVPAALAHCDLLFLPSRSENFGHAIFEALSCGVPVLIGNATPWQNLEADAAGWELPLDDPRAFASVIDRFAAMDAAARASLRAGARARGALGSR